MHTPPLQSARYVAAMILVAAFFTVLSASPALADGKVMPPADYQGSLEERAQEAILIFHTSQEPGGSREDLILKIQVEGEADQFAWIVPFPNVPKVAQEDPELFNELFDYVEARLAGLRGGSKYPSDAKTAAEPEAKHPGVEVLSRKVVGKFDVAIVREKVAGALNEWLEKEGYQTFTGDDADEVLAFYRDKQYVFACIKVSEAELQKDAPVDVHPLRFSFQPGGRDGMYFPMKLTGLQQQPFDVNLYIFYGKWVNDHLSKFGYEYRGFRRKYRDWDTSECEPDAGKAYSAPQHDVFLKSMAYRLPLTTKLFQKLHPGERYYLTNIQAGGLEPKDVLQWADDLWLFPYYTDPGFVPYDAQPGGPASATWPESYPADEDGEASASAVASVVDAQAWVIPGLGIGIAVAALAAIGVGVVCVRKTRNNGSTPQSGFNTAAPEKLTDAP